MNRINSQTISQANEKEFEQRNQAALIDFKQHFDASFYQQRAPLLETLDKAIQQKDVETVKKCLANPLLSMTRCQVTFLKMAIQSENREIFDLLLKRKELDLRPKHNSASLFITALNLNNTNGDYFASELAKRGFNPNPDLEKIQILLLERYPICKAQNCMQDIKNFLKFLSFQGYNEDGNNPLHQAISDKDLAKFNEILLSGKAVLDACAMNGETPLELALFLWYQEPSNPTGLAMVKALLEKRADPHAIGSYGYNFWDWMIVKKPQGYEAFMKQFFTEKSHFSSRFMHEFNLKFDGLKDEQAIAVQNERTYRQAMATILGIEFADELDGNSKRYEGGSPYSEIFKHVVHALETFICPEIYSEDFDKLKKAMKLAQLMGSNGARFDENWHEISKEDAWNAVSLVLASGEYPITIPIRLPGHAVNMTLYKNQVYICNRGYWPMEQQPGIHIYEMKKPLTKELFFELISVHSTESDEPKTKMKELSFLISIHEKLGLNKEEIIHMHPQEHPNCPWSSSISLGMKCVLLALKQNGSFENIVENYGKIKPFAKQLNHFIKYNLIDNYVQSMKSLMEKSAEKPSFIMLGKIVKKLIYKIENKRPLFYKRALDSILFSGVSLALLNKREKRATSQRQEAFTRKLAKVYEVRAEVLHNSERIIS